MKKEQHAHQRHYDELFDKLLPEIRHRALDEGGPVVGRHDLHAGRQARLEGGDLRLDRVDGFERVLAKSHDDHASRYFALAVEFGDASAHLRPDLNARDVGEAHGNSRIGSRERNLAEVVERLQIAARAHHVLRLAQFEHRTAGFLVGALDRLDHLCLRDVERAQPHRIEHDLILLHHAADARDFGNIVNGFQLVLEKPVLQRA